MALPNSSYSQLSAVTKRYFLPKLIDNVFLGNPLLSRAKKKGWYKKVDGGSQVVIPLEYAVNGQSGWFTGADTLSLQDTDVFSAVALDWKQLYAPVTVTRRDELMNMGDAQVVDFVKSKMKNAEKTMQKKLSLGLYSAGTDADSIIGLGSWIATSSTIGGISQTSNTWFAGQVDSTTTTLTMSALQTMANLCSEDNDSPTVAVCGKTLYNAYYALLQPQQRFVDSETAKGGFSSLMFNGIPMISDTNATASNLYMLNENYLHLIAHSQEDFRATDFDDLTNQAVKVMKIFWAGVLAVSNPRLQGRFSALTA